MLYNHHAISLSLSLYTHINRGQPNPSFHLLRTTTSDSRSEKSGFPLLGAGVMLPVTSLPSVVSSSPDPEEEVWLVPVEGGGVTAWVASQTKARVAS